MLSVQGLVFHSVPLRLVEKTNKSKYCKENSNFVIDVLKMCTYMHLY